MGAGGNEGVTLVPEPAVHASARRDLRVRETAIADHRQGQLRDGASQLAAFLAGELMRRRGALDDRVIA